MKNSILNGKKILIVDDEPDVILLLEEEITHACPDCILDKAGSYEGASSLLLDQTYNLVILDIMGVRGFDLLDIAVKRGFKVVMLTAHAFSAEALKRSIRMGAHSYLPKEKLGELIPFLEDVLNHEYESGWKILFEKLHKSFTVGFEKDWEKDPDAPWHDWVRGKYL